MPLIFHQIYQLIQVLQHVSDISMTCQVEWDESSKCVIFQVIDPTRQCLVYVPFPHARWYPTVNSVNDTLNFPWYMSVQMMLAWLRPLGKDDMKQMNIMCTGHSQHSFRASDHPLLQSRLAGNMYYNDGTIITCAAIKCSFVAPQGATANRNKNKALSSSSGGGHVTTHLADESRPKDEAVNITLDQNLGGAHVVPIERLPDGVVSSCWIWSVPLTRYLSYETIQQLRRSYSSLPTNATMVSSRSEAIVRIHFPHSMLLGKLFRDQSVLGDHVQWASHGPNHFSFSVQSETGAFLISMPCVHDHDEKKQESKSVFVDPTTLDESQTRQQHQQQNTHATFRVAELCRLYGAFYQWKSLHYSLRILRTCIKWNKTYQPIQLWIPNVLHHAKTVDQSVDLVAHAPMCMDFFASAKDIPFHLILWSELNNESGHGHDSVLGTGMWDATPFKDRLDNDAQLNIQIDRF